MSRQSHLSTDTLDNALLAAIENQDADMITNLIQQGASLTHQNNNGQTPAQFAAGQGHWDALITLANDATNVSKEAKFSGALLVSLYCQQWRAAEAILQHPVLGLWQYTSTRNGLLHTAIEKKAPGRLMNLLIQQGASLTHLNNDGQTPAQFAARQSHWDALITLANAATNVSKEAKFSDALLVSLSHWQWRAAEAILQHPVLAPTWHYMTTRNGLLHTAIEKNAPDRLMTLLIQQGTSLTHLNRDKENPLHTAVRTNASLKIVILLLGFGVNINEKNSAGETPLAISIRTGQKSTSDSLINPNFYQIAYKEAYMLWVVARQSNLSKLPYDVMHRIYTNFLGFSSEAFVILCQLVDQDIDHAKKAILVNSKNTRTKWAADVNENWTGFEKFQYLQEKIQESSNDQDKSIYVQILLNKFSHHQNGIEAVLLALETMKAFYQNSKKGLLTIFHKKIDPVDARNNLIEICSNKLITRKATSPLAYYMRGIITNNPQDLKRAKQQNTYLKNNLKSNGRITELTEKQLTDLEARLITVEEFKLNHGRAARECIETLSILAAARSEEVDLSPGSVSRVTMPGSANQMP